MLSYFRKTRLKGIEHLRDSLSFTRVAPQLDELPDRFARLLEQYDAIDCTPAFRQDVHDVLAGAAEIAEAMVDPTFSVEIAGEKIAKQLQILGRALTYLSSRPATTGYAILQPGSGQLVGQFTTREEAEGHKNTLIRLGASPACKVVPTRVLSQHALQPRAPIQRPVFVGEPPQAEPLPNGIIPNGILPNGDVAARSIPSVPASLPTEQVQQHLEALREEVEPKLAETITSANQKSRLADLEQASLELMKGLKK